MRPLAPWLQYATPRLALPTGSSLSGTCCTQIVRPVAGSNASTRPIPFDAYNTPPTMIGVERKLLAGRSFGFCSSSEGSS